MKTDFIWKNHLNGNFLYLKSPLKDSLFAGIRMDEIRIAVAGIGNCCSSLLQGLYYYKKSDALGLLNKNLGGYSPSDIKLVAAFDISKEKVGKDVSEAIYGAPNNAPKIADVPNQNITVQLGPAPDIYIKDAFSTIEIVEGSSVNVVEVLRNTKADILVNLISGGNDKATLEYAKYALEGNCAYINATPTSVASESDWVKKFEKASLPIVGDDLLDQVGATILHIGLLEFLINRGVRVDESYQLDVGGGSESINTLEKTRAMKRFIKTNAVTDHVPYEFPLVSGSTDFVDFLGNGRDSFFWIKGRYYGGTPFTMDVKLSSFDAPNSGAILLDVIRGVKIAKDKQIYGSIDAINAYGFKKAKRHSLAKAYQMFRDFTG